MRAGDDMAMVAYDVVVYGGVPSGIAAAVAAARWGLSVLLVEPSAHVGGLSTSGLNTAESEHMLTWTFGGLAQEFYRRVGRCYGVGRPTYYFESSVAERVFLQMLEEADVTVWYGQRVARVDVEDGWIRRLTLTGGEAVTASTFVDASYEGDLMARAGVDYTYGREGREEFDEDLAGIRFDAEPRRATTVDADGRLLPGISGWAHEVVPGAADPTVMNYNWRLCFSNHPDNRVEIPEPDHYDRSRYALLEHWLREQVRAGRKVELTDILDLYQHAPGRPDKWEVNNKQDAIISLGHLGAQVDYPDADYTTREQIVAEHKRYTLGLFYFLANDTSVPENVRAEMRRWGLAKDEFVDNGHWPYQLYVREARRMRGAYVMTQHDVCHDRRKSDAVAVGSHFIDSHHVQRFAVSQSEFINEGRIWRAGWAYQVPYRALTPKKHQCRNLLVPGAASFTHVAFCTYRLESTWMMAGHAAGVAAAIASEAGLPVQEVDVAELQRRLRQDGQVLDFVRGAPERFTLDPGEEF